MGKFPTFSSPASSANRFASIFKLCFARFASSKTMRFFSSASAEFSPGGVLFVTNDAASWSMARLGGEKSGSRFTRAAMSESSVFVRPARWC